MQVSYVLDTEDFLFRPQKKSKTLQQNGSCHDDQAKISKRVQRFHRLLSSSSWHAFLQQSGSGVYNCFSSLFIPSSKQEKTSSRSLFFKKNYLNSLYYLCSQILLRRLASECIICFGAGNAFVGASPKIIFDLFSYPSHQVKGDMGLQDRSVVEACGILSHNHACK